MLISVWLNELMIQSLFYTFSIIVIMKHLVKFAEDLTVICGGTVHMSKMFYLDISFLDNLLLYCDMY